MTKQELVAFHAPDVVILVRSASDSDFSFGTINYRVKERLWMTRGQSSIANTDNVYRITDEHVIDILEKAFSEGISSATVDDGGNYSWQ